MRERNIKNKKLKIKNEEVVLIFQDSISFIFYLLPLILLFAGCSGYSNKSLYSQDIKSVYVEMFDNTTFQRDLEYDLTDAIAKRIEAETPYKIISDRSRADTVLSGKITAIDTSPLTIERETGRAWRTRPRLWLSSTGKTSGPASICSKTQLLLRPQVIRSFSSKASIMLQRPPQINSLKELLSRCRQSGKKS